MSPVQFPAYAWHHFPRAGEEQLRELQRAYGFHDLDIEDCLSEHERPKIEEYEHYLFLVFHLPFLHKATGRIVKEEVHIFLGRTFLITLHEGRIPVFEALQAELRDESSKAFSFFSQGPSFLLYELMSRLFDSGFPIVDTITRQLRTIELQLFENEEEADVLRDILTLKRNVITMRSILLPQRSLVALLEHKHKQFIDEDLDIYFDNILDAIERQWALLDTAKEMGEALQDTHESWLSHKTNTIIRILTVINAFSLPLVIVTSFYGMNVPLPFMHSPWAAVGILGVLLGLSLLSLWYSWWKRWL